MAQSEEYSERTQPPSRQHLLEARKRGQVARSADLTGAVVLLAALTVLALLGGELLDALTRMTATLLSAEKGANAAAITGVLWKAAAPVVGLVAIIAGAILTVAVLAGMMQVGLTVSTEPLGLDFTRLSPASGLGRIFSLRALARGAAAAAKVLAVALVGWLTLREEFSSLFFSPAGDAAGIAAAAATAIYRLAGRLGAVLLVLGVGDYLCRRWQHRRDLRMSPREARDEARRSGAARAVRPDRRDRRRAGTNERIDAIESTGVSNG